VAYRPYLLNDQPVEVETQITVNFMLSGDRTGPGFPLGSCTIERSKIATPTQTRHSRNRRAKSRADIIAGL